MVAFNGEELYFSISVCTYIHDVVLPYNYWSSLFLLVIKNETVT